jgi:hypothetical protein
VLSLEGVCGAASQEEVRESWQPVFQALQDIERSVQNTDIETPLGGGSCNEYYLAEVLYRFRDLL